MPLITTKHNSGIYYHGNCLEVMKDIEDKSIDMILCDLPYGSTKCKWDVIIPFEPLWEQYKRIVRDDAAIVLFGIQPFTTDVISSNRKMFKYCLVWKKNVPTGMSQAKYSPMRYHEDIIVFCKSKTKYNPIMKERIGIGKACYNYDHYCGKSNHVNYKKIKKKYDPDFVYPSSVLEFNVVPNRNGKIHPTQKPVTLFEYLIKTYSNEGDLILDNCAGSGTTAIAAINTNRKWICIEKDEDYYNKSIERINETIQNSNEL